MTAVHLRRVDSARNMSRFYRLDIQPDLFGGVLLVKQWGRIGAAGAPWPSVTTATPLPPTPCNGKLNARGGEVTPTPGAAAMLVRKQFRG
jgi:hypothetical protein